MYTIHKVQPHSGKLLSNKEVNVTEFEDSEAKTIARERCQTRLWIQSIETNSVVFEIQASISPVVFSI